NAKQKKAVKQLITVLEEAEDADTIQSAIFEAARDNDIKVGKFFRILYKILLNTSCGPKLGPYIYTIGPKKVAKTLRKNL
ncbi:MAG: lysine--tRNA ligase, partial [Asgard group archaeon]|nr:lysine--tRNA ligase [Asgard group archaeon]